MANFPVDPVPFIPGDYQVLHVDGRPQQCRHHVAGVIARRHEDLAIATILLDFPGDQPFALTRNFLRQFMEEETQCTLKISQRCPLGSAFVLVSTIADRDWLVERSPHEFHGRQISFIEHNKGLNHRAFNYNRECWLMLLAYPADLWSDEHIRGVVKDFGVLVDWDKELSSYAALIVKMRIFHLLMDLLPILCLLFHILSHSSTTLLMLGHNGSLLLNRSMDFSSKAHLVALTISLLNDEEFLELNDLINPMQHNVVQVPDVQMHDFQEMINPIIQNGPANENMIIEQPADNHSELTLTISTDPSSASGSVNGVVNQGIIHQNLHIGMVLIQDQIHELPLPELEGNLNLPVNDSFLFSKEGTTAWASYFKPTTAMATAVTVLAQWADFFTAKLLSPEDFDWAKSLMQSKVWQILSEGFSTPQAAKPRQLLDPPVSTSPLCASDVRRSPRLTAANKGYRAKTCFDKNCLACASAAPPIKKSVVKNLCSKFSIQVNDEDDELPPQSSTSQQNRSPKKKKLLTKKQVNDAVKKPKKK
ncbi:hypothetical protein ACQ4PT_055323 [Festuca glaucescens]